MKCLTWNLEWASLSCKRARPIVERINQVDPDIACYTEIVRNFIPKGDFIESETDYGYSNTEKKRKVVLWSKSSWTDVDSFGDPELPSGRIVSGITQNIRFIGICIPWKDAHVRTGRKDRNTWEDHLSFCAGLGRIITRYSNDNIPVCILGDYNQRIPRTFQPESVANALLNSIPEKFNIATEGIKDSDGKDLIDHIAVSPSLDAVIAQIIPHTTSEGFRLSDHVGVVSEIKNNKANQSLHIYGDNA